MFTDISNFENLIANYYGAPYAVATDSCTHAVELCLRLKNIKHTKCPKHTYLSIPMTFNKLSIDWNWSDNSWKKYYYLENTNIIDAAVLWEENSYIPKTLMCLSFQFKKHLGLGRGGMILLDCFNSYNELIKMSYDGRLRDKLWADQNIETMGYHYYMTPETAQLGIEKFHLVKNQSPKVWSYLDYPDLSNMKVFQNAQ